MANANVTHLVHNPAHNLFRNSSLHRLEAYTFTMVIDNGTKPFLGDSVGFGLLCQVKGDSDFNPNFRRHLFGEVIFAFFIKMIFAIYRQVHGLSYCCFFNSYFISC